MGVLDFLVFIGEIRGLARGDARDRARGWLDRLDLAGWAGRRCADLSKGMQQKVQFAATVLHDPELLILDEPFSGLDPINQDELEAIVLDFHARGSTILFSTHRMEQAERLCRRVCLMAGARKILDGEIRELKARARRGTVAVAFDGDADWVEGPGVARAEPAGDGWHLTLEEGADAEAVLRRGLAAGVGIRRFEMVEPRLHEIFVDHVAAAGGGRPPNPTGSPGRRRRAAETPAGGTP
jgi:ABC-2 type transport system ATP-binding protein